MLLVSRWPKSVMIGASVLAAASTARTAHDARSRATAPCESLVSGALDQTLVEHAEVVPAGRFTLPTAVTQNTWAGVAEVPPDHLPAFCRVQLRLKPTPNSDVGAEVWLPESTWNGKFVAVGNGGIGGQVNWRMLAAMVAQGYAAASTDAGHHAANLFDAFLGHPEAVTDHAVRAVHATTVAAKQIVQQFYGRAPRYAYWNGSSTGGRQGIKSALEFPDDFDGIVAGSPLNDAVRVSIAQSWKIPAILKRGTATTISPASLALLNQAVLKACDGLDAIVDGVIERPDQCRFDPASLQCGGSGAASACLTAGEVAMATALYAPLTNPRTGVVIADGFAPGSELAWTFPVSQAPGTYQAVLYLQQRDWNGEFDFDRDVDRLFTLDNRRMDASSPDLSRFFQRGGKLLQVHGWSDATVPPGSSIRYGEHVMGQARDSSLVRGAYRLFMVPGMGHSRGGTGVTTFDSMRAIEEWVEAGRAPDRIDAARMVNGTVVRTRPLCAWPRAAQWDGRGSPDSVASFACAMRSGK